MALLLYFILALFAILTSGKANPLSLEDTEGVHTVFSRTDRDADESGDGSTDIIECMSSLTVDAFSLMSVTLTDTVNECTSQTSAYYDYEVIVSDSGIESFVISSGDEYLLFADHFSLGNSYELLVEGICDSCDVQIVELTLDIAVNSYEERLFPFGNVLSDRSLSEANDHQYSEVNFDIPFAVPVYDKTHRRAYINTNGVVSFEKPQFNWYPSPFPFGESRIPILAPYWTDLDLTQSSIYYNTYHRTDGQRGETLLSLVSQRVNDHASEEFSGQWMLVSTWSKVPLYSSETEDEVATFQIVLVTDFETSYVLYLYDDFHFNKLVSSPTIGHSAADYVTYYNVEFDSSDAYLHMDNEIGNTGVIGQWMFNISHQNVIDEDELSCIQWSREQQPADWADGLPSCPCTRQQANQDWRYSFELSQRADCAIFLPSATQSTVECCYDSQDVLVASSKEGSGGYVRYHPVFYPEAYLSNDKDPYVHCCEDSSNCETFRIYRPLADCKAYTAPATGFLWGDPHFETLDGNSFTFNGIGEYTLLSSSVNALDVQVRMEQYLTTDASVITAVAVQYYQLPVIQLELSSSNEYLLYFNGKDRSNILPNEEDSLTVFTVDGVYNADNLTEVQMDGQNVFIIYTNNSFILTTNTGLNIRVGSELTFLHCSMELGDEFIDNTQGLLGYYDKDSTNDYRLPDGTTISENTSEETLYEEFGIKWHIIEGDSLFTYKDGMSYDHYNSDTLTFTPVFGTGKLDSDLELKTKAEAECNGEYSCLYDTAQTGNITVGIETYKVRNQFKTTKSELENFPPSINGSSFQLIVMAGTQYTAEYTASDPDTSASSAINIKDPAPEGIELNSTGHLVIDITFLPSLPLYLSSSDVNDTTTIQRVSILLCDCDNNGTCIKDHSYLPFDSNGHYRLPCECSVGFGGLYCEEDLRGCGQSPCPLYTTCEADSSAPGGYKCGNCEAGYHNKDGKCIDIDECLEGSHSCSQQCINTDGSYMCSCNEGYRLNSDGITCDDINECLESTDECAQSCSNTDGSYECSCQILFEPSANGLSCDPENPCLPDVPDVTCSCDIDVTYCVCQKGYSAIASNCIECSSGYGYVCENPCDCRNGGTCTSQGCLCTPGYTGYNCDTEINDHQPIFSNNSITSIKLPESLPVNSLIAYFNASDNDVGAAGEVIYSIVSPTYGLPSGVSDGLGVFKINNESGLLQTTVSLVDQNVEEYYIEIEARDEGVSPNKNSHFLYIELVNRTLPQPYFNLNEYQDIVYENKSQGSIVLNDVTCLEERSISDDVVDLNIEIISGNVNSSFEVVDNVIMTVKSLDYESVKRFELELRCTNPFNESAQVNASIIILNINDNPYEFDESLYSIDVYENATIGSYIGTFHASDADHPDLVTQYYLTTNSFSDIFLLNKTTGVLSVGTVTPFDRESLDNYDLQLTANLYNTDSSIKHTAIADVSVTIKDVNDFVPLFEQSLYVSTNLSQNNIYDDTVIYVYASDEDLGVNSLITFTIQDNSYFDIDSSTGRVFVNATFLDRGTYVLSLNATDSGFPPLTGVAVIEMYVKATPNEIYFTKNKYAFNVLEDSALGFIAGNVEASLYDIVNVSIATELKFTIESGVSVPFLVKSKSGEIIVLSSLDYEGQVFYEFKVIVSYPEDISIPIATTTVQISVIDVNDNSPVFIPSVYSIVMYDDSVIGTTILSVHATDVDEDGNQPITFEIDNDFYGPFDINSTSGSIYVNKDLGLPHDYHFMVIATDLGQPSLSSEAIVHISVVRRAAIHPLLNSAKIVFDILESVNSADSPVGTIQALIDGNVTIASEHGIGFRVREPDYGSIADVPFKIDEITGDVTTLDYMFDYEKQQEFLFYVELFDIDTLIIYDTAPVQVKLLDVNDKGPEFDEDFYSGSVSSTTESGSMILTVLATDGDSGMNADIRYSLTSSIIGFHVDAFTGELTVVNETHSPGEYTMSITATDQGSPVQLSSTVNVHVLVIADGAQNISFSQDSYVFSVNENSPKDTVIDEVTVIAVHGETFGYDDLSFELFPASDCISNNGRSIIVNCNNLDREIQSVYYLSVIVTHLTEGVSGTVDVQVNIIDLNDNAPLFERNVYNILARDDFNTTFPLLTPIVIDADGSESITTFTINTVNPSVFVIDSNTGVVTMTAVPIAGDYSFEIIATDALDITLSSTATVLVSIYEPGPKTLDFTQSSLSHSIAENSPGGTKIGVLELLAPELVDPAEYIDNLEFSILSGNNADYFHIINYNATLTLLNDFLDRETEDTHVILVQANFKDFKITAQAHVTIIVTDENDNSPQFTKGVYSTSISSNSEVGTTIITVTANDDDLGNNANVFYSFEDSQTNFEIDNTTGGVSILASLSADTHYKLVVVATDEGVPQLSSTAVVSVFVESERPDSISFTLDTYDFSITENNALGSYVGTVGINENAELLVGLVFVFVTPSDPEDADNLELFHLDAVNGNISALSSIDREAVHEVIATVMAEVPDEPSLTASATVRITILDQNDHTPTFEESIYLDDSLTEGSISITTIIITVNAIDEDQDDNGEITYQLSSDGDSEHFSIDSSGNIRSASTDLESGYYHITVTATDNGAIPLTGTAEVLITIYAPLVNGISFKQSNYVFDIYEDALPGTVLSDTNLKLNPINFDFISLLQYTASNDDFVVIGDGVDVDLYSLITFDYESDSQTYEFQITATAHLTVGDIDTVSAVTTVTVNILDTNDNAPQFNDKPEDGPYLAQVIENTGSNQLIIQLDIEDKDSGSNGELKLSLVDDYGKIVKITDGEAIRTLNKKIDREIYPLLSLTVIAADNGNPSLTSTATILVTVLDLNDNSPAMLSGSVFHVFEEQVPNTVLFRVVATDPDNGINGTVTYGLHGDDVEYFGINSTSGDVYNKMRFDYEDDQQKKNFELTLNLIDGGSRMTEETIQVYLSDVPNDNAPQFTISKNQPTVAKDADTTFVIAQINAHDPDGDSLSYEIDNNQFAINSNGVLTKANNEQLDIETIPVVITITDDSSYSLATVISITITVVDKIVTSTSSTMSSTSVTTTTSTSTSISPQPTGPTTSPGGNSGIIGFAIAAVFGILFVLAVIVIVILLVLTSSKRRERVKKKDETIRDPYDVAEENWILQDTTGAKKKDKKEKKGKKKSKNKKTDIEMDRRSSLVDSSAYETMYEDDMIDLATSLPWTVDSNYLADSEDNPRTSGKNLRKPAFSSTKPKLKAPAVSKPGPIKPPSLNTSRPNAATSKPPSLNKPTPSPAKPGVTKPVPKATGISSAAKTTPSTTVPKLNPPPKKSTTAKAVAPPKKTPLSSKPPSKQSSISSSNQSSPPKRRSKRASSIDSTADEIDTAKYLSEYGSAAPMKSGERPSEYDFFLKPDESGKPPVGARPSLKNLGWSQ